MEGREIKKTGHSGGREIYLGIPDSDTGDLGSAVVWDQVRCLR